MPAHFARKRFGQHFLKDRAVLEQIIDAFNPLQGQQVVEIGPGRGALTDCLLARIPRLVAIELDRDLVSLLEKKYPPEQLEILQKDVLKVDFARLAGALGSKLRLIGNLPYNISTPLLFHLLDALTHIEDMVFMVQKEVAMRLAANPGSGAYGRLTVMTQLHLRTSVLFEVPASAFVPPPKVTSAVIRMEPLADKPDMPDPQLLATIVRQAFSQRRKTLRNSLSSLVTASNFETAGIEPTLRPENLEPMQFLRLCHAVTESKGND